MDEKTFESECSDTCVQFSNKVKLPIYSIEESFD